MRLISVCAAVNNGIGVTSVDDDVVAVVIIIFESEAGGDPAIMSKKIWEEGYRAQNRDSVFRGVKMMEGKKNRSQLRVVVVVA